MRHAALLAAAIVCAAAPVAAQTASIAGRIAAVREGTVLMYFAARPGVCGDGRGSVWTSSGDNLRYNCIPGPVVVRIGRTDGQTISVRTTVGYRGTPAAMTDLGEVSAPEAAKFFVALARTIGGRSADDALSAAAFADGADISSDLRALVRDDDVPLQSRKQALFWLGQTDATTRDLVALDGDLTNHSLREHYTFVLSQRHDEESVDKLIDIARADRDVQVRKQALFWLGQSKDPKVLKFFRDLIVR
jgi:hypothetical protein